MTWRDALISARDALHRLCLERRSTDGYAAVFAEINAALFPGPSTDSGAVDRVGISARKAIADAIKDDPADGDWVVWITPTDAADAALRGLEAAGLEVRPSTSRGVV